MPGFYHLIAGELITIQHRSRSRTNGATQTFRRPSLATGFSHQRENTQPTTNNPPQSTGVYVPPHLNSNYQSTFTRNGATTDSRYSKDQLLDLFRAQGESGNLSKNLPDLLLGGWNSGAPNTSNGTWSRRDDLKEGNIGPEVCWDFEGSVQPLGLVDVEDEEKEVRTSTKLVLFK